MRGLEGKLAGMHHELKLPFTGHRWQRRVFPAPLRPTTATTGGLQPSIYPELRAALPGRSTQAT